jgi:glycosyltransferase involved in cell wall biosynthesis
VSIDGHVLVAEVGRLRPDVARVRPSAPSALRSGWVAEVDLRSFDGREIVIDAYVVRDSGLVDQLPRRIAKVVATRLAHFVSPRDDDEVAADFAPVQGVALSSEPVARVELFVNGQPAGPARLYAEPSPEVDVRSIPWSGVAAFSSLVDVRRFEPGERVSITGTVTSLSGAATPVMPARVVVGAPSVAPFDAAAVEHLRETIARVAVPRATNARDTRLVMVTHDLGLGGGQLYLTELARQLQHRVSWPMLVITQRDGALRGSLEDAGIAVHVCGDFPLGDPVAYESKLLELATVVRDFGGNIVLSNTMLAAIGADLARRVDLPSVLAIHESYGFDEFFAVGYPPGTPHPVVRDQIHAALTHSAAVVFEADSTRMLYEVEGDPRRFVTVRYGVPVDEIEEYVKATDQSDLRRRHGLPEDATILLCMGTIEPRKAQAMLASSFADVATRHPEAMLVMVGDRDDIYCRALRTLIDTLGLADRVHLVPIVDDTRPWYRMADVLVSASDLESMPRSILEAMAYGLPVVAARAFGVAEIVEDEVTGWLFEPRDAAALGQALDRVLGLPAHVRREVAGAASELVRERHDSSGYGAAYERLLSGLAVDPGTPPADLLRSC